MCMPFCMSESSHHLSMFILSFSITIVCSSTQSPLASFRATDTNAHFIKHFWIFPLSLNAYIWLLYFPPLNPMHHSPTNSHTWTFFFKIFPNLPIVFQCLFIRFLLLLYFHLLIPIHPLPAQRLTLTFSKRFWILPSSFNVYSFIYLILFYFYLLIHRHPKTRMYLMFDSCYRLSMSIHLFI